MVQINDAQVMPLRSQRDRRSIQTLCCKYRGILERVGHRAGPKNARETYKLYSRVFPTKIGYYGQLALRTTFSTTSNVDSGGTRLHISFVRVLIDYTSFAFPITALERPTKKVVTQGTANSSIRDRTSSPSLYFIALIQ